MSDRERDQNCIQLQVAGAQERDIGKGISRIARSVLQGSSLSEGDTTEVKSKKRSTAAVVLPPYPEDEGLEIIRLDGLQRANLAVSIGDSVEVCRAKVKPAKKVVLAPAQKNIRLMGEGASLKRTLNGRRWFPETSFLPLCIVKARIWIRAYFLKKFSVRFLSSVLLVFTKYDCWLPPQHQEVSCVPSPSPRM